MKLNITTVSTRPNRIGHKIANWMFKFAFDNPHGFIIEHTDLADLNLPLYNEPEHPSKQAYIHEHTIKWSEIVASSDAFVFVLPEYNFTAPPSFYNAIDYLFKEWAYKPAGFVSYGGVSGGLRSTQMAKLMLTSMNVMPIQQQVVIPNVFAHLDDIQFKADEHHNNSADTMLSELYKWAKALKELREESK